MAKPDVSADEQLPGPSAEAVFIRVQTEALITVLGRKKGAMFVRLMDDAFADEQRMASVVPLRPSSMNAVVRSKRWQAAALFDAMRPLFMARVPRR